MKNSQKKDCSTQTLMTNKKREKVKKKSIQKQQYGCLEHIYEWNVITTTFNRIRIICLNTMSYGWDLSTRGVLFDKYEPYL